jgi:hypothetical protein
MPCRSGYETDSGISNLTNTRNVAGNAFKSNLHLPIGETLVSREKLDDVVALLCEVCRIMELRNDDSYFKNNPELRKWWQAHKEEDRIRLEKEKKEKEEARKSLETIHRRQKKYLKYILDENLEAEDRDYFQKKMSVLRLKEEGILQRFKDLEIKDEK